MARSIPTLLLFWTFLDFNCLMADDKLDASSKIVRDDRWGSDLDDWQLISSSVNSNSGPGVNTYMKSYPGMKYIHGVPDLKKFYGQLPVVCTIAMLSFIKLFYHLKSVHICQACNSV